MQTVGLDLLEATLRGTTHSAKMVFNEHGAIVFAAGSQHRDMKLDGVSYEDDYKGNALAAMIMPCKIDVRYHAHFKAPEVAAILNRLLGGAGLLPLPDLTLTYQGKVIALD